MSSPIIANVFISLSILIFIPACFSRTNLPRNPELFVRKVILEDPKSGITNKFEDLGRLEESKYFHKVLPNISNQFHVDEKVQGFVISCQADYPVYWNFNQDEGGPIRDKDTGFILYTERNASIPSTNDNLVPVTNNYLANIQVVAKRSEFTGSYSCHSVSNPMVHKTIFLYVREKYEESNLVYKGQDISIPLHYEGQITLPCLVNTPNLKPADDIVLIRLEGVDRGRETWKKLVRNESIKFDPTKGFHLKTKELHGLIGRYRCVSGTKFDTTGDYVNISIITNEPANEPHFGDPERTKEIGPDAAFEFLRWDSSFYEGREAADASCCSSDDTSPIIYESECYNPANCANLRKLMATNKLSHGRGSDTRGYFRNCTTTSFVYDAAVGHVFKCFGKGVYVMAEFFPTLVSDDKEQPWARFHSHEEIVKSSDSLSLKINIADLKTNNDLEYTYKTADFKNFTSIDFADNSTRSLLVANCYYVEYFISDGLFFKIIYQNGTIQWIKGSIDEQKSWPDRYRLNSNPFPIYLSMEVEDIDKLSSISCYGPKWNSSEWTFATLNIKDYIVDDMDKGAVNKTVGSIEESSKAKLETGT